MGDDIGGGVVVIVVQHRPDGAEAVTAGDHRGLSACDPHLAEPHRGSESVAQAEPTGRGGSITTLGDIIVNGLPWAPVADAASRLHICLAQVA